MESPEPIVQFIVRTIRESPGGSVIGAQLGSRIRVGFSEFSPAKFECANLRQFVNRYASSTVRVVARPDADVLYSLNSDSFEPSNSSLTAALGEDNHGQNALDTSQEAPKAGATGDGTYAPSVWSTFCSPSGAYRLFGNKSSGELRALPSGAEALDDSWIHIPSLTSEFLLRVAKDFVSELPEDLRTVCEQSFESEEWWVELFARLKQTGLGSKFHLNRQRIVERELSNELDRLGIPIIHSHRQTPSVPVPVPGNVDSSVAPSRDLLDAVPQKLASPATHEPRLTRPTKTTLRDSSPDAELRRAAMAAIQRMSIQELRELRVPLGLIFDVLYRG